MFENTFCRKAISGNRTSASKSKSESNRAQVIDIAYFQTNLINFFCWLNCDPVMTDSDTTSRWQTDICVSSVTHNVNRRRVSREVGIEQRKMLCKQCQSTNTTEDLQSWWQCRTVSRQRWQQCIRIYNHFDTTLLHKHNVTMLTPKSAITVTVHLVTSTCSTTVCFCLSDWSHVSRPNTQFTYSSVFMF